MIKMMIKIVNDCWKRDSWIFNQLFVFKYIIWKYIEKWKKNRDDYDNIEIGYLQQIFKIFTRLLTIDERVRNLEIYSRQC